jgi:methylenetetrahydrofolate--tRNA-(uracil-5-)-methyltransferase
MAAAEKARVPAGSALAVDREVFSAAIEEGLTSLPNLTLCASGLMPCPRRG